jgi:hypothetical protein
MVLCCHVICYSYNNNKDLCKQIWLGHVIRMDKTRPVKKIFEGKLEGRRGRGRPRLRWINDVEDDSRKLGVKRWRTKALDRVEWASIVREGKAKLKGP